jgi:hypothetical protein
MEHTTRLNLHENSDDVKWSSKWKGKTANIKGEGFKLKW